MGSGDPGSHLHVCCKSTAPQGLNKSRTTFSLAVSRAWMLRKECIGTASRRKLRWLLRGSYLKVTPSCVLPQTPQLWRAYLCPLYLWLHLGCGVHTHIVAMFILLQNQSDLQWQSAESGHIIHLFFPLLIHSFIHSFTKSVTFKYLVNIYDVKLNTLLKKAKSRKAESSRKQKACVEDNSRKYTCTDREEQCNPKMLWMRSEQIPVDQIRTKIHLKQASFFLFSWMKSHCGLVITRVLFYICLP